MTSHDFLVSKTDLHTCRIAPAVLDADYKPAEGEILLKVDRFAFTANNVTYAVFGHHMKYWDFFPADNGYGRIPVWGFADVVASGVDGIEAGERFYGYLPMSSYLIVTPEKLSAGGFMDGAAHRAHLSPIYNYYTRTSTDPAYRSDRQDLQSLFRPLFTTSFLVEDFMRDNDCFGAEAVILSSASSKTAFGAAFQFMQQRIGTTPAIIGLTSPSNVNFTRSLGCYDDVVTYDDIETLDNNRKTVFIDMAGSGEVRARIHDHFADTLTYSCSVGASHWESNRGTSELKGPSPILFFAPAQGQKRTRELGSEEFQRQVGDAWATFIDQAKDWVSVSRQSGPDAITAVYKDMVSGNVDPKVGHILSFE